MKTIYEFTIMHIYLIIMSFGFGALVSFLFFKWLLYKQKNDWDKD